MSFPTITFRPELSTPSFPTKNYNRIRTDWVPRVGINKQRRGFNGDPVLENWLAKSELRDIMDIRE